MKHSIISVLVAVSLGTASLAANAENTWKDTASDAWIDGKAETTLMLNGNLDSFDINTDVKNGKVTLTGKVNREVDKALATELVMSLDGVKDVDNQLTVIDEMDDEQDGEVMQSLNDAKIETVVKTRLMFESEVSGMDIEVESKMGKVTLSGTVDNDAERQLAVQIAENTNDVKSVVDMLKSEEEGTMSKKH
ncbi:BON domain-containing protein [Paraglaciecola polaris]|uniref:Transport-associated protein n=1 Tax=Paraglaciecola polaris LMG 21857 TaxID=1129793 RepID=K6YH88_9ALTE|nr:BON domain-containing protein [Paraglaciecola polaris]GAC32104.1 transport-associated protein [Paraglaciecola polaris LMG 21857]